MPAPFPVTEHVASTSRHTTFYLACGADTAPLIIFVHGWPELAISWRHQLPVFAALGFRAIAPDMRGYGSSTVHAAHQDYAIANIVQDMRELLAALGRDKAIWVGHDWGSPVVWSLASHHPQCCHSVANLCVPYIPNGFALDNLLPLVDRAVYPAAEFPAGQWDYMFFYRENFAKARATFEANLRNTVKAIFRSGIPDAAAKPSRTATIRRDGGWFGGTGQAPDIPMDQAILTEQDMYAYTAALQRNGFFGPDSWYMNHEANMAYAAQAMNDGRLTMPVLFLHGAYDYTCATLISRLADPMRAHCSNLTEAVIRSGHWMAQEKPAEVNAALARFLANACPDVWPQ